MSKRSLALWIVLCALSISSAARAATFAINPATVDVGPVRVNGNASANGHLTATQNTNVKLVVDGGGDCPGQFTVQPTTPFSVDSGGTDITVRFAPGSAGAKLCLIHVVDPSTNLDLFSFNAAGTGAVPTLTVTKMPDDFGHVDVPTTSGPTTITIKNTGTATLNIASAAIAVAADQYAIATGTTGAQTVAPDATASWTVTCSPTTPGAHNGTFRITSDSNGTAGAQTNLSLTCIGDQAIITLVPTSFDFGGVPVNVQVQTTFTIANTGNVDITGFAGALDIANKGYAFDAATVPATLVAGAAPKQLTVTFKPLNSSDGGPANINFAGTWNGHAIAKAFGLNGDGQNVDFTALPDTLAFGPFRFDSRPTKSYVIKNTGEAPITFNQALTTDAGTATNEIAFVVKKGSNTVTFPQTLNATEQLDVTVTLNPANRTGAIGGKVDVTTNFAGLTKSVTISGDAKAAVIDAADLDFGAVDIDGPAITKTVHIRNTGTAPLDVSAVTKQADGGANADSINRFTLTLPAATTVAPNTELAIDITYKPTVQKGPGTFDHFLLKATLTGALNGPAAAMINVQGRGIDRVFAITSDPVAFPPTFRNPGDSAPTRTITVENHGEATLKVTGAMVTGDPVWTLVDGGPVDIPGNGSHDFTVRFAPTTIGPAPAGKIAFTTDDNARPTGEVVLAGNGIGRMVAFGPQTIDLGFTGIGIPVTAEVLDVANMDSATTFKIRAIELNDTGAFQIVDAPDDETLPALASKRFAIKFTPSAAGHFETRATLFLDQDSEEQAEVMITGDAVFVEARGGGGCSTGHDAGGLLALALAGLFVRRRRAATALAAVIGLGTLGLAARARADGIDATVFEPTPSTTGTGFQLQAADVGAPGSFAVSTILSYASNPLVLEARGADGAVMSTDALVERSSELQLGAAFALRGRFELGASLPLFTQSGQEAGDPQAGFSVPPVSGNAIGNLALHGKASLVRAAGFALGAGASVTIPTATEDQFTGADKPAVRVLLLAGYAPMPRLSFTVNAGGVLRGKSEYANIAQQSAIAWGVGASVRILDPLWATAEVFGEATPSGKRGQAMGMAGAPTAVLSPAEWLAGVRVQLDRRFTVGLAGGRGITNALGTPEVRGVLSLAFVPGAAAVAPIHPIEPPRPDGDADGDGIPDSLDRCPNEPEDKDLFEDDDGCPDLDNDHDGIPDALDKCPLDAEDKDGYQDDDGCPDKDNDGDGIPDAQDKCPNEPEDKDGFQDVDGCPDLDNDHDGIPDDKDKCPNEPETINGFQDDDGCPDKGDSTILLSPDRIELLDPVTFTGTKLTRQSFPLLAQVGATLRAHTEIVRVRVTVHVQPTADADADQAKSEKRAQVVRDWLVQWGIAATRVEARGFGGTKPLVPADRKGAAKINDRLELIILERK
jgi:MYXO-CTERM domain-containing protein